MVVPLGNGRRAISCRFFIPLKLKVNKLDKVDTFNLLVFCTIMHLASKKVPQTIVLSKKKHKYLCRSQNFYIFAPAIHRVR